MKKALILIFLCLVFINAESFAQVEWGVKSGVGVTSMSFDGKDYSSEHAQWNYFIGPVVKFALPIKCLDIEVGALYDYKESDFEALNTTGDAWRFYKIEQKQLLIPANLRLGFSLFKDNLGFYLFAGPQFGIVLDGKDVKTENSSWSHNKINLGANFGVGTTLFKHLELALAFSADLTNAGEVKVDNDNIAGKYGALQLNLGVYF
ncbi:MAG: PorT family protein [Mediterranea massiliensis]|nr:PorT family protein [Mediterranea massiliensis]